MIIYLDTSALGRVYLGDQSDSDELAGRLYSGEWPMITSELTDVEIASAFARAARDGAIEAKTVAELLARYKADTSDDGPLGVIPLDRATISRAREYVLQTSVRSLDAIHLAACSGFADESADEVWLLSRDHRQLEAARTLGIPLIDG